MFVPEKSLKTIFLSGTFSRKLPNRQNNRIGTASFNRKVMDVNINLADRFPCGVNRNPFCPPFYVKGELNSLV